MRTPSLSRKIGEKNAHYTRDITVPVKRIFGHQNYFLKIERLKIDFENWLLINFSVIFLEMRLKNWENFGSRRQTVVCRRACVRVKRWGRVSENTAKIAIEALLSELNELIRTILKAVALGCLLKALAGHGWTAAGSKEPHMGFGSSSHRARFSLLSDC